MVEVASDERFDCGVSLGYLYLSLENLFLNFLAGTSVGKERSEFAKERERLWLTDSREWEKVKFSKW